MDLPLDCDVDQHIVPRELINARFHDLLYDQCALHSNLEDDAHEEEDHHIHDA